jgi:hypothetical protein
VLWYRPLRKWNVSVERLHVYAQQRAAISPPPLSYPERYSNCRLHDRSRLSIEKTPSWTTPSPWDRRHLTLISTAVQEAKKKNECQRLESNQLLCFPETSRSALPTLSTAVRWIGVPIQIGEQRTNHCTTSAKFYLG